MQILCLANGERIAMTAGMRVVFEVDSLAQASPATVSRCAMVYMVRYHTGRYSHDISHQNSEIFRKFGP